MASDYEAIGSAVYSILSGVSGSGTVPVFYALAPGTAQPPYLVFQRLEGRDERTFDDSSHLTTTQYMIKVISDRDWPQSAWATYGLYHATLDGKQLSMSGYQALRCTRSSTLEYMDNDKFWHVGGIYDIDVYG